MAYIHLYQGQFQKAIEVLDDGIAADRIDQYDGWNYSYKLSLKAYIYNKTGDDILAQKNIKEAMETRQKADTSDVLYWRDNYIEFLTMYGEVKKAEEILISLKEDIEKKDNQDIEDYWWAAGIVALSKGEANHAIDCFKKADSLVSYHYFRFKYDLAKAYIEADLIGEAVNVLEKAATRYDTYRIEYPIHSVEVYYLLGLAYEKSGWNNKAIEQYETFLDIWKNADEGVPSIEDARARLARLKSES